MIISLQLRFLHIPKTAGSIVQNVLHRNFKDAEQIEINIYDKSKSSSLDISKEHFKLIRGHFPFTPPANSLGKTIEYCTLLREPLDRCVSHYYYMRARREKGVGATTKNINAPLADLCLNGEFMFVDNLQVRMLSGMFDVPFGTVDNEMVEKAWSNLQNYFPVFGIQEQLNIFLLQLSHRYSLRTPYYRNQRVNLSRPKTRDIDSGTAEAVLGLNKFDVALFERVKNRVQKEIEIAGIELENELKQFERKNKIRSKLLSFVPFGRGAQSITD